MKSGLAQITSGLMKFSVYAYLVVVLGVLAILYLTGDRWWFGTVLLYGPRWIYLLPMAVLVPIALAWQRRSLWLLGLTFIVITWPIMGLNVSVNRWLSESVQSELRVVTYNVHRWEVSGDEITALLNEVQPDLLAVQECASPRRVKNKIPEKWFTESAGYSLVVSRHPISRCESWRRGKEINGLYCVIETPGGPVGFGNVDLLTPRRALKTILDRETIFDLTQVDYAQERIAQRWQESEELQRWLQAFPESDKVFAGDFNLTVDSPIFRSFWAQYQNAYGQTTFGYGHTKITRINIFRYKSRIDHILATSRLRPLDSWVGPDFGSDHLPLVADFAWR
ncbi:endonuclease/exonuclease/phosphatase family protein [Sulfuriflexus sp.]|uniref:endonuclease/exonuclease/phosphatase family protein n=1 Tax=Sulfuriflexus sp. TaxID=2015443 RepID=UPI0028CBF24D|nr:endonuclease/exonuclease/phosphatase family protein [Sulfuriflexus sp.]MDT8405487.1 endonuclease/exonuclease/phosphatase family protein [Sulfuriflexus sp.]